MQNKLVHNSYFTWQKQGSVSTYIRVFGDELKFAEISPGHLDQLADDVTDLLSGRKSRLELKDQGKTYFYAPWQSLKYNWLNRTQYFDFFFQHRYCYLKRYSNDWASLRKGDIAEWCSTHAPHTDWNSAGYTVYVLSCNQTDRSRKNEHWKLAMGFITRYQQNYRRCWDKTQVIVLFFNSVFRVAVNDRLSATALISFSLF